MVNSSPSNFSAERLASKGSAHIYLPTPTRILLEKGSLPKASAVNNSPSRSLSSEVCPSVWPGVAITRNPAKVSPSSRTRSTFWADNGCLRAIKAPSLLGGMSGGCSPEMIGASRYGATTCACVAHHSTLPFAIRRSSILCVAYSPPWCHQAKSGASYREELNFYSPKLVEG